MKSKGDIFSTAAETVLSGPTARRNIKVKKLSVRGLSIVFQAIAILAGAVIWIACPGLVYAQVSPDMRGGTNPGFVKRSAENDCKSNAINFLDDPNLTREEKIARMDEALAASLDRYDACQAVDKKSAPSSGGNVGGGASQTASDMRGSEPDTVAQPLTSGGNVPTQNANLPGATTAPSLPCRPSSDHQLSAVQEIQF